VLSNGSTFEPLYFLILIPFVGLFAIWAWRRCAGKRKTGTVCPGGVGAQSTKQPVEDDPETVTTDNPVVQAQTLQRESVEDAIHPVSESNSTPVASAPPLMMENVPLRQIDRNARHMQILHSRRRKLPPLPPPEKDDEQDEQGAQRNVPHPSLFILTSSEEQNDEE